MSKLLPRTNINIIEETCINANILTIFTYKLGRVTHVEVEFNGKMRFSACTQHWERRHFWSRLKLVDDGETFELAVRHYKIMQGTLNSIKWEVANSDK